MDETKKISGERLEMLLEAMELLEEMHLYMAMFRKQRYSKLKDRVTLHTRRTEVIKLQDDDKA